MSAALTRYKREAVRVGVQAFSGRAFVVVRVVV
jgi:hypothetical protein